MKIALIQPNKPSNHRSSTLANFSEPGMGYLSSVAKQKGHDTLQIQQITQTNEEVIKEVTAYNPEVVGFSVYSYTISQAQQQARKIVSRLNNKPLVIFGNSGVFSEPGRVLSSESVDYIVLGEGELTFIELLERLESNKNINDIAGIGYKEGKKIKLNPLRKRIMNLDDLPMIDRKGYPIGSKHYIRMAPINPPPSEQIKASIYTSRGCPWNCGFCLSPSEWGRLWRGRSIENIVREIEFLKETYDINLIGIEDAESLLNEKRINELIKGMEKFDGSIKFYLEGRVSDIKDKETFRRLKEVGCTEIEFGVESGSQEVLDSYHKRITMKQINYAFESANMAGLTTHALLMLGGPNETYETIKETQNLLWQIRPDRVRISFFTPYKGTKIREELDKDNHLCHINSSDYSKWTTDHPVVGTKHIAAKEYYKVRKQILSKYYTSQIYDTSAKRKIMQNPKLAKSYDEFFMFLKQNNII